LGCMRMRCHTTWMGGGHAPGRGASHITLHAQQVMRAPRLCAGPRQQRQRRRRNGRCGCPGNERSVCGAGMASEGALWPARRAGAASWCRSSRWVSGCDDDGVSAGVVHGADEAAGSSFKPARFRHSRGIPGLIDFSQRCRVRVYSDFPGAPSRCSGTGYERALLRCFQWPSRRLKKPFHPHGGGRWRWVAGSPPGSCRPAAQPSSHALAQGEPGG
jgi:hypothetical protein